MASRVSLPSDLNGQFFYIFIDIFVTGTVHTVIHVYVIHASNFACALSHSPTMHSIPLVRITVEIVSYTCNIHGKGVHRANQANGGQLFWAGWPISAPCMPRCSVTA